MSAITFDNGAGEGGATEAVGTYGLLPDSVSVPVLENKVFGGYYDAPDGAGVRYFDENGEPTMAWDKTDGEVTLYAKWSSNIVTVIFLANGGNGAMDEIFFQPGDSVELSESLFARGDYAFAGWSFSETGGVAYPDKWEGELLDSLGGNPVAGDVVSLYAVWAPVTFNVKFSANGGKGAMAAQKFRTGTAAALRANAFTRSGYVFLGWAKSAALAGKWSVAWKNKQTVRDLVASGKTVTLYAVWAKAKYKVGYNAYGGTLPKGVKMAAQTHAYGTAAKLAKNQFVRSGYVFAGWATSKANAKSGVIAYGNAQKVKNLTPKGGTVTLYAVWAKPKYKIAFYANGGKGATVVQTVKYGQAVNLAKCNFAAPKGKKFAGWATSAAKAKAGKVKYKNKAAVKNLLLTGKTVKLYAIWKKQ
ncbi:MAG: InlB B-repeat-containing protein [Kiritimatiellae bacterium]|nr:InlB B-repeat-containing protein [Kiritimatiellia bacterium]